MVDARRQDSLDCGRYLHPLEGLGQPIGPGGASQDRRLDQGTHALFQEEGITLGTPNQKRCKWRQAGVTPQQRREECLSAGGWQRVEPQVRVIGLAAPAVLVLRPIVDQEQQARRRQVLDEAVE
jgi:hypothetical protein